AFLHERGGISGTGNLIKTGQGMLALAAATTYSGTTDLVNGRITASAFGTPIDMLPSTTTLTMENNSFLILSNDQTLATLNDDNLGTSTIRLQGHNLTVGGGNSDSAYSGTISDGAAPNGVFTKVGTGAFTLTGTNTYSGTTNVDNGFLIISNDS